MRASNTLALQIAHLLRDQLQKHTHGGVAVVAPLAVSEEEQVIGEVLHACVFFPSTLRKS